MSLPDPLIDAEAKRPREAEGLATVMQQRESSRAVTQARALTTVPESVPWPHQAGGVSGQGAVQLRAGRKGRVPRVKISQSRIPKDHTSLRVV